MLDHGNRPSTEVQRALQEASAFIFDVDGTLIERQGSLSQELGTILATSNKTLSIATSRAIDELGEIFNTSGFTLPDLFNGVVIIEDGCLALMPNQSEFTHFTHEHERKAVHDFIAHVHRHLSPIPFEDKWSQLGAIDFPLVHVPSYYNYQSSASIWQQVIGTPRGLHRVMEWCQAAAQELGVHNLIQLLEIGDGTLRVTIPGHSKGSALLEAHRLGAIDLGSSVFFCDGKNDIPAALEVKKKGGCVIAVDRHCSELLSLADYTTSIRGPHALKALLR